MFISAIKIKNFRNFEDAEISLNPGLNVLIGENNAGKSNLLQAIQLVFSNKFSKKLSIHDFYKGIKAFDSPPLIIITAIIQGDKFDTSEDKATIAPWLTKLESPWQATLQFIFSLPDKHHTEYQKDIQKIKDKQAGVGSYWDNLECYLPKYTARIFGGNPDSKNKADYELLEKIDCQLLDAIRDVETRMFSGKSPLLRDILECFLDHDIKEDSKIDDEIKKQQITDRQELFLSLSKPVVKELNSRISLANITTFADKTGASKGGTPALCGEICEREVIDALQLMIKHLGFEIPIYCNGLGYNNLLYLALLLAKIDVQISKEYNGENSIVFPLLLIEEPEAHLHPALQFQFLRFLRDELASRKSSKQIFITTHSTHIAAAVDLDAIIVLSRVNDKFKAAYPGKVFSDSDEDKKSKDYVQRYLDATKSNMLFSKGVIFVEGISEQLLVPCFAEYMNKKIEDSHVAVTRVDGLTFKHFVKLFGTGITADRLKYALETNVACVIDADPKRLLKTGTKRRWQKCFPFEIDIDKTSYEYQKTSTTSTALDNTISPNVKICYVNDGKGKTFEYEIAFNNPTFSLLPSDSMPTEDKSVLTTLISHFTESYDAYIADKEDEDVKKSLSFCLWTDDEKKRAKFAANYLFAIEKGDNAFGLQQRLRENLLKQPAERVAFIIPEYIKTAINWVS